MHRTCLVLFKEDWIQFLGECINNHMNLLVLCVLRLFSRGKRGRGWDWLGKEMVQRLPLKIMGYPKLESSL